jgi:hypothetical protein
MMAVTRDFVKESEAPFADLVRPSTNLVAASRKNHHLRVSVSQESKLMNN